MNLSPEYLALKAQAKEGEIFLATLTQELAKDLLSRSKYCRPPHPKWVKQFTYIFRNDLYEVNKKDSTPIVIQNNNDLLHGVQRLHGFIKSKSKAVTMKFVFVDNPIKAVSYIMLQWTPQSSMKWMRAEKRILDSVEKRHKEKR